ncbi:MAG: YdaU family protein [Chloroflexi bacterium]|nr:YdaU family protein [Chloroflexota bacterium]
MHYYQFNIGDYTSHTRHLTPMEDIAYRRLLDFYYLHEAPIPLDYEKAARLIAMNDRSTDVEQVLNEFFIKTENGWENERASKEISVFQGKKQAASAAGKASGRARKAKKNNKNERTLNKTRTTVEQPLNDCSTDVEPNINHKPIYSDTKVSGAAAPDLAKMIFDEGIKLLTNAGQTEKSARSLIGKLRKFQKADSKALAVIMDARDKSDPAAWIQKCTLPTNKRGVNRQGCAV